MREAYGEEFGKTGHQLAGHEADGTAVVPGVELRGKSAPGNDSGRTRGVPKPHDSVG